MLHIMMIARDRWWWLWLIIFLLSLFLRLYTSHASRFFATFKAFFYYAARAHFARALRNIVRANFLQIQQIPPGKTRAARVSNAWQRFLKRPRGITRQFHIIRSAAPVLRDEIYRSSFLSKLSRYLAGAARRGGRNKEWLSLSTVSPLSEESLFSFEVAFSSPSPFADFFARG